MLLLAQIWTTHDTAQRNRVMYLLCCAAAAEQSDNRDTEHDLKDSRSWRAVRVAFPFLEKSGSPRLELKTGHEPMLNVVNAQPENVDTFEANNWLDQFLDMTKCSISAAPPEHENKRSDTANQYYAAESITLLEGPALPAIELQFSDETEYLKEDRLSARAKTLALDYERRRITGEEEKVDALDWASFSAPGKNDTPAPNLTAAHGAWDEEEYEETPVELKLIENFHNTLSRYPSQILRYAYGGKPLLSCIPTWNVKDQTTSPINDIEPDKKKATLKPPPCGLCGAPRLFEFQLMPSFWTSLADARKACGKTSLLERFIENSGDWSTIAVFTCSSDCQEHAHNLFVAEEPVALCRML